jgi:hypothetical protein
MGCFNQRDSGETVMFDRRRLFAATLALVAAFATANPALALSATSPDGGAKVTTNDKTMFVEDALADNHSVYGYANNETNRLENHEGSGSTIQRTYGFKVTTIQACTDIPLKRGLLLRLGLLACD